MIILKIIGVFVVIGISLIALIRDITKTTDEALKDHYKRNK